MADWLALHGLQRDDCRMRLAIATVGPMGAVPDPAFPVAEGISVVLAAMEQALPSAKDILGRIRTEVRIDLAPDLQRFPRAFTLHDDGRGLPYISCPVRGRCSDLLLVAHEIGHACQLLACPTSNLPPVLRETAAYLAEELVCASSGPALRSIHQARTMRIMARDGAALLRALDRPSAGYRYNWNYPIARDLAARAVRHLTPDAQWGVFAGRVGLHDLLRLEPA